MTTNPKPGAHRTIESTTGEHGVSGYTKGAVGGFGEDYDAQAAQGAEDDEPSGSAEDIALARTVRKSLAHAHLDAADLRAEVLGGTVTLYGSVRHESEKAVLEARARAVPGVVSVTSRLSIASAPGTPR
jgi:osmotically-inducible protein OsmY